MVYVCPLPGTNRAAIRYKHELDAKTSYLQVKLEEQAVEVGHHCHSHLKYAWITPACPAVLQMERLLYQMPDKAAQMRQPPTYGAPKRPRVALAKAPSIQGGWAKPPPQQVQGAR